MEQQTLSKQNHQSRNNFIRETLVNAWPLAEGTHVRARVHTYRTPTSGSGLKEAKVQFDKN